MGRLQVLGNHLDIPKHRHEVRVAHPPRHYVNVQVIVDTGAGGPDLLHRPECPAGAFCPRRARCRSASRAAACSACFLLDPLPSPRMRPLASTVATKILAWSGPSWLLIRYLGMRRSRSCSSSCNVLL